MNYGEYEDRGELVVTNRPRVLDSVRAGGSSTFNYDGEDAAFKIGQDLASARASYKQAMMDDPLSVIGAKNRIQAMQAYLNAYRNGMQLPGQHVLPPVRVTNASSDSSYDFEGGPSVNASLARVPKREE